MLVSTTARRIAIALALGGALAVSRCTINGSRSLGEDCLQNRECASGLTCQPSPNGRYVCQPLNEAGNQFVTDAQLDAMDANADDAATAE